MDKCVVNVVTGEVVVVPLTPDEEASAAMRTAEELAVLKRVEIEAKRDAALAEGCEWNGRRWHMDDVMRSALMWRIQRWSLGRLGDAEMLPVRAMDNTIHMFGRDDHIALAEAIEATCAAIYAESWVQKDSL